MIPVLPFIPAGLWIPTGTDSMPKEGVEVPILYRPRKNSKPQLCLAHWDPNTEYSGPGWLNERDQEFYPPAKVSHWMSVQLPPEEKR